MPTKILCPYCFEHFDNTDAYYQCESDERNSDGDYRCDRVTSDDFDKYWDEKDLLIRNVWPQNNGFFGRLMGAKFKSQKCPKCGYNSRRFVCPHCLNWIPTEMVEKGCEIISVIGSPRSGKTNYIVALIHQLRKYGYKMDLQVTPTQVYRDGHKDESTQNLYKNFDNALFRDKQPLEKTAENKVDIPWIFHLYQQQTDKSIYLVFYDTAGERFADNIQNSAKYLKESSAVIVILDVLSIKYVKDVLKKSGLDEFAGIPSPEIDEIQTALNNFKRNSENQVENKPFAFVFSKFDAVLNHSKELDDLDISAFKSGDRLLDSSYIKSGKVDLDKIDEISETIELTLDQQWDAGDFLMFAQNWASKKNKGLSQNKRNPNDPDNNYKFFGVSAFGNMPDDSTHLLEKVEPYRVMDPLLWVLHKLGQFKIETK